jgi:ADP-ribosylglycohydrolase
MAYDLLDAVYGCFIGAAIGDALGAPVEGWNYWRIQEEYGRLEKMVGSTRGNTNGLPGGVTGGTALQQYVALAIVRAEGRIGPDDLAALWIEKGSSGLFGSNERVVFEKLSWGADPWDSGRGGTPSNAATAAVGPVGIINAANPVQAYQDGYALASVVQDGVERDAAAALAAAVSQALTPGATLADVVSATKQVGSGLMRRALDLTLGLTMTSRSIEGFTRVYYEQMADWWLPLPPHRLQPVQEGYPAKARYSSGGSLEHVSVALALLQLCGGDPNQCIVEGVNFGRNCNAIASIVGSIAGALHGATQIRREWIDTCEEANRDLCIGLEDDQTASFYSTAWRLVNALKGERLSTESRLKTLDKLLGR